MKKRLGYKIRTIRIIKNIPHDIIAKRLNISLSSYLNLENGSAEIDEDKLTRIAAALEVETDTIKNFKVHL
jgi:transcriptional regulator with XRE-family HTH domain